MSEGKMSRLIPLTKWNQYHTWPPIGGLRYLVANAKEKNCIKVFVKAGGRWLVDEDAFLAWVYSCKEK